MTGEATPDAGVDANGAVWLTITTPGPERRPVYEFTVDVERFDLAGGRELVAQLERLVRIADHVEALWTAKHPDDEEATDGSS